MHVSFWVAKYADTFRDEAMSAGGGELAAVPRKGERVYLSVLRPLDEPRVPAGAYEVVAVDWGFRSWPNPTIDPMMNADVYLRKL